MDLIERQAAIEWCLEGLNNMPSAQPEPCEDAVSRKDVKLALCRAVHPKVEDDKLPCTNQTCSCLWSKTMVCDYAREVDKLPSVAPERKKGKWIFKERREPVYDISGVKTWGIAYMCSECRFIHTVIEDFGQYVFCPNCGADNRGENEY